MNEEPSAWLVVILASVGTGVAGLISLLLAGAKDTLRDLILAVRQRITRGAVGPVQLIEQHAEFQSILTAAKAIPNVERILVFIGHNEGGLPKDECRYTVRAVAGWTTKGTDPTMPVRAFEFDLVIDQSYADMLHRINKNGFTEEVVDQMTPGSLLRGMYETEGVVSALVYKLHHDKRTNTFCFCSAASHSRPFADAEKSQIAILVSRLRAFLGGSR